jgi:hypothetical protein
MPEFFLFVIKKKADKNETKAAAPKTVLNKKTVNPTEHNWIIVDIRSVDSLMK